MLGDLIKKKKIWIFQNRLESSVLIIKDLINAVIKIQGLLCTYSFLCLNEMSVLK